MFELHVWGPAFGLPSVDAECLATILYFTHATFPETEWTLIPTSPSAVPTNRLPSLRDPNSNTWIASFDAIVAYAVRRPCISAPASIPTPSLSGEPTSSLGSPPLPLARDLNASLTPEQRAKASALSAFLSTHALPLVALSLYTSSANWADTTRPAYSHILPFPLTWTEPPAVRLAMSACAEHLGLSAIDTDAQPDDDAQSSHGPTAHASTPTTSGWLKVPRHLVTPRPGVREIFTPEERSLIRLNATAREVLDVLDAACQWFLPLAAGAGEDEALSAPGHLTTAECLSFGYLALMLVPPVPRPWLRNVLATEYPALAAFVTYWRTRYGFIADGRGGAEHRLPWRPASHRPGRVASLLDLASRLAWGSIAGIPGVGDAVVRWRRRGADVWQLVSVAGGATAVGAVAVVARWWWQQRPPLGALVHFWERPRSGLRGLGAVGALLGEYAGEDY